MPRTRISNDPEKPLLISNDDDELFEMESVLREMRNNAASLHQLLEWAAIGREVLAAVGGADELKIRRYDGVYNVTAVPGISSTRVSLRDALMGAGNREQTKRCGMCGHKKPLKDFAKSKKTKDGYWWYDRQCERERRKQYSAKHKECERERRKQYNGKGKGSKLPIAD